MTQITLTGDDWVQIHAGNDHAKMVHVDFGEVYLSIGTLDVAGFYQYLKTGDSCSVAANTAIFGKLKGWKSIVSVGDWSDEVIPIVPEDQAIVDNATTPTILPATGTTPSQGTVSRTIAGSVESLRLAANKAILTTGATGVLQNSAGAAPGGNATVTIAANAVTNIRTPATVAPVVTGTQAITDGQGVSSTATRTVASGAITTTVLPGTDCIAKNGQSVTNNEGMTITLVIANGKLGFNYNP